MINPPKYGSELWCNRWTFAFYLIAKAILVSMSEELWYSNCKQEGYTFLTNICRGYVSST